MCGGSRPSWIFLYMLCMVLSAGFAEAHVILAKVGGSVDLHWAVPPPSPAEWLTLRLFIQRSNSLQVVFAFSNGQERVDQQDRKFWNRTQLYQDNITLSLRHVTPWDEGGYECHLFLLKEGSYSREHSDEVHLSAWAEFSLPHIGIRSGHDTAQRTAWCTSHNGYPKAQVIWKPVQEQHENITQPAEPQQHPVTGLYNVSEHLMLQPAARGDLRCCVLYLELEVCSDPIDVTTTSPESTQPNLRGAGRKTNPGDQHILIPLFLVLLLAYCEE